MIFSSEARAFIMLLSADLFAILTATGVTVSFSTIPYASAFTTIPKAPDPRVFPVGE